jgi:hypothetical protein
MVRTRAESIPARKNDTRIAAPAGADAHQSRTVPPGMPGPVLLASQGMAD